MFVLGLVNKELFEINFHKHQQLIWHTFWGEGSGIRVKRTREINSFIGSSLSVKNVSGLNCSSYWFTASQPWKPSPCVLQVIIAPKTLSSEVTTKWGCRKSHNNHNSKFLLHLSTSPHSRLSKADKSPLLYSRMPATKSGWILSMQRSIVYVFTIVCSFLGHWPWLM